jgi:hypothetical protein
MKWRTIREATEEDYERLADAAREFCTLHKMAIPDDEPDPAAFVLGRSTPRLLRLWRQCAARALGAPGAEGIENGHVGFRSE